MSTKNLKLFFVEKWIINIEFKKKKTKKTLIAALARNQGYKGEDLN